MALAGQVAFRGLYMGGYDVAKGLLPRDARGGKGGGDLLARLGAAQVRGALTALTAISPLPSSLPSPTDLDSMPSPSLRW